MARYTKSDVQASRDWLLSVLKPGDTVYTVLRHVSRSGMQRQIDCYVVRDNQPLWITRHVAKVCDYNLANGGHGPLKVDGCGMDMGFSVVYYLSAALWPKGYGCTGKGCQSNDHSNGDRDYTPHMNDADRAGADGTLCSCHANHWHRDGGYSLRQSWM